MLRQTLPFVFSSANDWGEAKSLNPLDDTQPNFSILGQLESFRSSSDNKFKFKLTYPQESALSGQANIWKQSSNPVTATSGGVDEYVSIETPWTDNLWNGLEKHWGYSPLRSFIDGSVDAPDYWYAIAASILHNDRIPGPGITVSQVELRVWEEAGAILLVGVGVGVGVYA